MLNFTFWSSDILIFGILFILFFVTETPTEHHFHWDITSIKKEKENHKNLTIKDIQRQLQEGAKKILFLADYLPEVPTNISLLDKSKNKQHDKSQQNNSQHNNNNSENKPKENGISVIIQKDEKIQVIEEKEKEKEKFEKENELLLKNQLQEAQQTIETLMNQLNKIESKLQTHSKENEFLRCQNLALNLDLDITGEKFDHFRLAYKGRIKKEAVLKRNIHDLETQNKTQYSRLEQEEKLRKIQQEEKEEEMIHKRNQLMKEHHQELQHITAHYEEQINELELQVQQQKQEGFNTLKRNEEEIMELKKILIKKENEIINLRESIETERRQKYIKLNEEQEEKLKSLLQQLEQEKASIDLLIKKKENLSLEIDRLSEQLYQMNQMKKKELDELQYLSIDKTKINPLTTTTTTTPEYTGRRTNTFSSSLSDYTGRRMVIKTSSKKFLCRTKKPCTSILLTRK
ncbi:unnamed protein product [Cunninghamella blakesleeana]